MTLARVRSIESFFVRLIPVLGEYRNHLVIAGGMARDLYVHLPGFVDLGLGGAMTLDVDIAVDDPLRVIGDRRLHEVLVAAGLKYHTLDPYRERPPMGMILTPVQGRYFPAAIKEPTKRDPHVEFITQLRDRAGNSNAKPQRDELIAFTLHYVDLLLTAPVTVEIPKLGPVRLPHPLAYIIQKTLIRPERQVNRHNFQKDTADAFKIVICTRALWTTWTALFQEWSAHHTFGPWMTSIRTAWPALFDKTTGTGLSEVCVAYPQYTPEVVMQVMKEFQHAIRDAPAHK